MRAGVDTLPRRSEATVKSKGRRLAGKGISRFRRFSLIGYGSRRSARWVSRCRGRRIAESIGGCGAGSTCTGSDDGDQHNENAEASHVSPFSLYIWCTKWRERPRHGASAHCTPAEFSRVEREGRETIACRCCHRPIFLNTLPPSRRSDRTASAGMPPRSHLSCASRARRSPSRAPYATAA